MQPELWSREKFHEVVAGRLAGRKLIAVSNREPFIHEYGRGGAIECRRPASGLATALHPIMTASGGTWIAHGSGNADRAVTDDKGRLQVPPEAPAYTLRRVWLTEEQERGYYYGLSNEGLWPLCHIAFVRPVFRPADWATYREVNEIFARTVLDEANGEPALVFIQDYHFGLLPRMLRRMGGENLLIAHFWHVPWPNREVFRAFPWAEELVDGLLGNDVMGFHIRYHCQNFRDTVDRVIEARVDNDFSEITRGGRVTRVRPYPISIDFEEDTLLAQRAEVMAAMNRWQERLQLPDGIRIGAAIERLDYSKGIPFRLMGFEHFLEQHPDWHGRVTLIQVAAPSRASLDAYQREEQDITAAAARLNERFGTGDWKPLHLLEEHQGSVEMMALHRLADFFMINSLHDGMNLVAKEFIASRADEQGVLILSRFTGAFRELPESVGFNPFSIHDIASAIRAALEMPASEQSHRMKLMREHVAFHNVYRWGWKILATLLRLELPAVDEGD
jgi:trehalose 6-phosphate synthase